MTELSKETLNDIITSLKKNISIKDRDIWEQKSEIEVCKEAIAHYKDQYESIRRQNAICQKELSVLQNALAERVSEEVAIK